MPLPLVPRPHNASSIRFRYRTMQLPEPLLVRASEKYVRPTPSSPARLIRTTRPRVERITGLLSLVTATSHATPHLCRSTLRLPKTGQPPPPIVGLGAEQPHSHKPLMPWRRQSIPGKTAINTSQRHYFARAEYLHHLESFYQHPPNPAPTQRVHHSNAAQRRIPLTPASTSSLPTVRAPSVHER